MNNLERWNINENLLQSYRQIFINSQSFLLAVGAFSIGENHLLMFVLSGIGLIMIWYIWFPVVRSRHLIVDYYKYQSIKDDPIDDYIVCSEYEYIRDKVKRQEFNKHFSVGKNIRTTRFKIDVLIPILYSLAWGIMLFSQIS